MTGSVLISWTGPLSYTTGDVVACGGVKGVGAGMTAVFTPVPPATGKELFIDAIGLANDAVEGWTLIAGVDTGVVFAIGLVSAIAGRLGVTAAAGEVADAVFCCCITYQIPNPAAPRMRRSSPLIRNPRHHQNHRPRLHRL